MRKVSKFYKVIISFLLGVCIMQTPSPILASEDSFFIMNTDEYKLNEGKSEGESEEESEEESKEKSEEKSKEKSDINTVQSTKQDITIDKKVDQQDNSTSTFVYQETQATEQFTPEEKIKNTRIFVVEYCILGILALLGLIGLLKWLGEIYE